MKKINTKQDILDVFCNEMIDSKTDILIDTIDVESVLQQKGIVILGRSDFFGKEAATVVLHRINNSLKRGYLSILDATTGIVQFTVHPDYPMMEIAEAMDYIYEEMNKDAEICWGVVTDEALPLEYAKATALIAPVTMLEVQPMHVTYPLDLLTSILWVNTILH